MQPTELPEERCCAKIKHLFGRGNEVAFLQQIVKKLKGWDSLSKWLLAIALILGFALRLFRLGTPSLWYDETVSAFLAQQSLLKLTLHTARDIHPPGYYYLLHFWVRVAGNSEYALRLPSLWFGLLLIPLAYKVGRRLCGARVAMWGAFLVAFSPYGLWYSQEARMYTLGAALGLVALHEALGMLADVEVAPAKAVRRSIRVGPMLKYVLAATAGLYTLYYFAFLLLFLNIYVIIWLLFRRRPPLPLPASLRSILSTKLPLWLLAQLAVVALYLPWLPIAVRQALEPPVPPWRSFTPLWRVVVESWSALSLGQSVAPGLVWPVLLCIGGLYLLGVASILAGKAPWPGEGEEADTWGPLARVSLLVGYTFAPVLFIYLASYWVILYHVRYVFICSPLFYLVLGAGLDCLAWPGLFRLPLPFVSSPLPFSLPPSARVGKEERLRTNSLSYSSPPDSLGQENGRQGQRSRFNLAANWSYSLPLAVFAGLLMAYGYSIYNYHFDPGFAPDDFRGAVQLIDDRWRPGDAVLINAGYTYPAYVYYHQGVISWRGRLTDYQGGVPMAEGPVVVQAGSIGDGSLQLPALAYANGPGKPGALGWGDPESDFYVTTREETEMALERLFRLHPRVWVLRAYDTVVDPDGFIRQWLDTHGVKLEDERFAGESNIRVQGYMPLQPTGTPTYPDDSVLGGILALRGHDGPTNPLPLSSFLDVTLYWEALVPLERDYAVSLKLFDTQGRIWAQKDELPLGTLLRTSLWPTKVLIRHPMRMAIPGGTPPGDYDLRLEVYDPASRRSLSVPGTGRGGVFVNLGSVTLLRPVWPMPPPPLQYGERVDFADSLILLGYNLAGEVFKPGEVVVVDLFWQSLSAPLPDYIVSVRLMDAGDRVAAQQESRPVMDRYPTTKWTEGEIVRDPHELTVPAMATSGLYHLVVELTRATNGENVLVARRVFLFGGGDAVTLRQLRVEGRPVDMRPPAAVQHHVGAHLGENVELVGYDLSAGEVKRGETLKLTLYWHARGVVGRNFKVFNHLVGPDGAIWGQRDSVPGNGTLPTAGWQQGEYLVDVYEIMVKPDAPAGRYTLLTGMYDEGTGIRLPAFDAKGQPLGDRIVLGEVMVVP
jgi:hypothetical protein